MGVAPVPVRKTRRVLMWALARADGSGRGTSGAANPRPGRSAPRSSREGSAAVDARGGKATVRPGTRGTVPRLAVAAQRRGAPSPPDFASYRDRRLVAQHPLARVPGALPGLQCGAAFSASGAADPVSGLRGLAKRVAVGRGTEPATRLLEEASLGSARAGGVADRPASPSRADR